MGPADMLGDDGVVCIVLYSIQLDDIISLLVRKERAQRRNVSSSVNT